MDPQLKCLLDSQADLRAALIVAARRIGKLQFGRKRDDPVLAPLRKVLREARAAARAAR